MSAAATIPPIGPNIVRAWFDSVFQPLLPSLDREADDLRKGRWQWRFRPASIACARAVSQYLDAHAIANLEQIRELYPEVRGLVSDHDRRVEALEGRCVELHRAICEDESFKQTWLSVREEALNALPRPLEDYFGAYPEADFLNVLAENLVNNRQRLPDHYAMADLWNRYGSSLAQLLHGPPLFDPVRALRVEGDALADVAEQLHNLLRGLRNQLSLATDVAPYDPRFDRRDP